MNISFQNPYFLFALIVLPIVFYFWHKNRRNQKATLNLSSLKGFASSKTFRNKIAYLPIWLRLITLALLIIALARPQSVEEHNQTFTSNGIDMVIATDVSMSMLAEDLKPNRLEALKEVASSFVKERISDRIGLVVYAAEAYTKTPITSDKSVIIDAISKIKYDRIIEDGTAIGTGLATAVNRLKNSLAKSKVIILMTDGVNNSGVITPEMATEIAKEYKIKVYTIGIGSNQKAITPVFMPDGSIQKMNLPVVIDEPLMKNIAKQTGGIYFRATDKKQLQKIYNEIDKMEKTQIDEQKFINKQEWFRPFVIMALILLLLEIILKRIILRGIV